MKIFNIFVFPPPVKSNNPNEKSNTQKKKEENVFPVKPKPTQWQFCYTTNKKKSKNRYKHEGRCAETFLYHGKHIDEYLD